MALPDPPSNDESSSFKSADVGKECSNNIHDPAFPSCNTKIKVSYLYNLNNLNTKNSIMPFP